MHETRQERRLRYQIAKAKLPYQRWPNRLGLWMEWYSPVICRGWTILGLWAAFVTAAVVAPALPEPPSYLELILPPMLLVFVFAEIVLLFPFSVIAVIIWFKPEAFHDEFHALQMWPPPAIRRAKRREARDAHDVSRKSTRQAHDARLEALREQLWREQAVHRDGASEDPFMREALDELDALLREPKRPERE